MDQKTKRMVYEGACIYFEDEPETPVAIVTAPKDYKLQCVMAEELARRWNAEDEDYGRNSG